MTDKKSKMCELEEIKSPSTFGIRHLQMFMMAICSLVIYVIRSSMGTAVLAMTDFNELNYTTGIQIYDWSEQIRGVILSSFFWGYMLMQIPAGIMCKQFGGKPMLLGALTINGLLALATPWLTKLGDWIAVVALRVCMGLTQACFMPATHTLIGQWAPPQERTTLGAIAYTGIQLGTILSLPLCGLLAGTAIGWTLIFYSMAGLAIATAALFWGFTASTPRLHRFIKEDEIEYIERSLSMKKDEVHVPIPWKEIFTSVPMWATQAAHIGINWSFIIFLVQIPTYLKNALGINLANSASLSALPFVGQWLVTSLSGVACDYICNNKILSLTATRKFFNSIASVGPCIGLIILSFISSENSTAAIIVLICTVSSLGASGSGYVMNSIDLAPRFAGVLFAITNCFANLIGLLGPLSAGFILGDNPTDINRWRIVFFIAAAILLVSDIIYRIFGSCELQSWNEAPETNYDLGVVKSQSMKNISSETNEETNEETKYVFNDNNKTSEFKFSQ